MNTEKITREEALKKISKSSSYGNLGLFIGAGMSMAILNNEYTEVALSWKDLIHRCALEFEIDIINELKTDGMSYPEVATEVGKLICIKKELDYKSAVNQLKEKIASMTSWYPDKDQRKLYGGLLEKLDPSWIITTNYDLIIEGLLTGKCVSLNSDDALTSPKNLIPIYHLHGIRTNPNSIIINQEDYISLFRPNQYRQQKLSLSIKESTTLIIGYGLGDVNVLTAVDWSKNVYSEQRISYPQDIIQLLYVKNPIKEPYRDRNDILIIEFNNLQDILIEITNNIKEHENSTKEHNNKLEKLNNFLNYPDNDNIEKFVDNKEFRISTIKAISLYNTELIAGFLILLSKAVELTWTRAKENKAFHAYDENLTILLDIIINTNIKTSPALLESVAYNLDRVAFYVGTTMGESRAAYLSWIERKEHIPNDVKTELQNIAKANSFYNLKHLLNK